MEWGSVFSGHPHFYPFKNVTTTLTMTFSLKNPLSRLLIRLLVTPILACLAQMMEPDTGGKSRTLLILQALL